MIIEKPLLGTIDVQVPDFANQGFVLGRSRLGDKLVDSGSAESWKTLIPNATAVSIRRGGTLKGLVQETDVGLLSVTLLNTEDPLAGSLLRRGDEVRVSMTLLGISYPLFTGNILDIRAKYPLNKSTGEEKAVITIDVADAVQVHTNTTRNGVRGSDAESPASGGKYGETFEARITRLANTSRVPLAIPDTPAEKVVWAL